MGKGMSPDSRPHTPVIETISSIDTGDRGSSGTLKSALHARSLSLPLHIYRCTNTHADTMHIHTYECIRIHHRMTHEAGERSQFFFIFDLLTLVPFPSFWSASWSSRSPHCDQPMFLRPTFCMKIYLFTGIVLKCWLENDAADNSLTVLSHKRNICVAPLGCSLAKWNGGGGLWRGMNWSSKP